MTSEADRARRSRSGGDIQSGAAGAQKVAAAAAPQAAVEPEAAEGPTTGDESVEETVDEIKAEDAAIEEAQASEAEAVATEEAAEAVDEDDTKS